jgi:hypothetical protein
MTSAEIAARIGNGIDLVTPAQRKPFRVTTSSYGLEFTLKSGRRRRTPWHGPQGRLYGVVELYDDWSAAGAPMETAWINRRMEETGVGTRNASYILATLAYLRKP